jgi:hypothetical protein
MQLLERGMEAQKLWRIVVPQHPAPVERQFVLWCARFSDAQIERAFYRTGMKRFNSTDPELVHRYTTGLLLNLEREQQHQQ